VTITDRDRKRLWGQAAATCSICRKVLVHPGDHPDDREALVGEEAHIISKSPNGPRGTAAVPGMNFDGYYNLILLCRIHHGIIDEQRHEYTVEKLRELKSRHEQWVRERLHAVPDASANIPIGLKPKFPGGGMVLSRLRTGKEAWHTVIGSSFYLLDSIGEDEASIEACDTADGFLTSLRDYAEIHDSITDRGFEAIRDAQRDLRKDIDQLASHGLVAFGAQRDMRITGGGGTSTPATMAVVVIRPQAQTEDDDGLPVVFPAEESLVFPDFFGSS
jgi:hypothetical protein